MWSTSINHYSGYELHFGTVSELNETISRLVAHPEATTAKHVITAAGDGFELEAVRDSDIEGVTGDYTLVSTWGSIRRILRADEGTQFV